jgi:hypothetical protein
MITSGEPHPHENEPWPEAPPQSGDPGSLPAPPVPPLPKGAPFRIPRAAPQSTAAKRRVSGFWFRVLAGVFVLLAPLAASDHGVVGFAACISAAFFPLVIAELRDIRGALEK